MAERRFAATLYSWQFRRGYMGYYAFYDGFGKEDGREGSSRGRKASWKYFKEGGLKNLMKLNDLTFRQMWKQDFARIRLRISVDFWLSLKLTRNYWDLLNSQRNIQFSLFSEYYGNKFIAIWTDCFINKYW